MPLDRLPPAPAPTIPSPKRAQRASGEDAQTFALPGNRESGAEKASRPDKAERKSESAREGKNREASASTRPEDAREAQSQTPDPQGPETANPALALNEVFSQAVTDAQETGATAETAATSSKAADAEAKTGAEARAHAVPPPGAGKAGPETSDAQSPSQSQARAGAQDSAAPITPAAAAQNDAAPDETIAFKPDSAAKSADAPRQSPADGEQPAAGEQARARTEQTAPQQTQPAPEPELEPEPEGTVEPSAARSASSADGEADVEADAARAVRDAQTARAEAVRSDDSRQQGRSTPDSSPASKDAAPQANADAEKAQAKSAETATAGKNAPEPTQGQSRSAETVADPAEAAASVQAAFKQAQQQAQSADSDRAPGMQNKSRHADKSDAGAKTPTPQGAPDSGANRSAAPDAATPTARPTPQPVAPANAPTDPLAWLLQESLIAEEALMDAPADTVDAELDMSTVRAEPRIEAARPSHHPQAHAASRFAPTTTHTLAAQIARKFNDGGRVFDIRLDPPELGRVEVRLELGPDNKVSAVLSAERADTLSELQRNSKDLEKALADAGLELGEDGLSFSLSEDNGAFNGFQDEAHSAPDGFAARNRFTVEVETDLPAAPLADALYGFAVSQRAGVNLIA